MAALRKRKKKTNENTNIIELKANANLPGSDSAKGHFRILCKSFNLYRRISKNGAKTLDVVTLYFRGITNLNRCPGSALLLSHLNKSKQSRQRKERARKNNVK